MLNHSNTSQSPFDLPFATSCTIEFNSFVERIVCKVVQEVESSGHDIYGARFVNISKMKSNQTHSQNVVSPY